VLAVIIHATLNGSSHFGANFSLPLTFHVTSSFLNTMSHTLKHMFFTLALWYWAAQCLQVSFIITTICQAFLIKSKLAFNLLFFIYINKCNTL
jgi:hypothetical protein